MSAAQIAETEQELQESLAALNIKLHTTYASNNIEAVEPTPPPNPRPKKGKSKRSAAKPRWGGAPKVSEKKKRMAAYAAKARVFSTPTKKKTKPKIDPILQQSINDMFSAMAAMSAANDPSQHDEDHEDRDRASPFSP
jgi:hypothetical protein